MLISIYFFLILLSFLFPKSKIIFFVLALFLIFLGGFCTNNADTSVYVQRYHSYNNLIINPEIGFLLYCKLLHLLGLNFLGFNIVSIIFIIGGVSCFIYKYSATIAMTLGLYAVFAYCIDVVQIRNSLAFILVLAAISCLINERTKFPKLKFSLYIILASTFHVTSLFYFIFLLINRISKNKILIASVAISAVLGLAMNYQNGLFIFKIIEGIIGSSKASILFQRFANYNLWALVKVYIVMCSTFGISMMLLWISKHIRIHGYKHFNDHFDNRCSLIVDHRMQIESMNILAMAALPLVMVSLDIYRLERYMVLLTYVGLSYYFLPHGNNINSRVFFTIICAGGVIIIFVLQIVGLGNFEPTFWSLFSHNYFL